MTAVQPPPVLEPGETPEDGVYPMPDLPPAVRAVLTVLLGHRAADEHVCEWPGGLKPDEARFVGHCNCGAYVDLAEQVTAALGLAGDADLVGTVADLRRQLRLAQSMERHASRHARDRDADVAEANERLAYAKAENARLTALIARTSAEKFNELDNALDEAERLRGERDALAATVSRLTGEILDRDGIRPAESGEARP